FQGYKKGVDLPTPDVRALFAEALAEGTRLMVPCAVVRWLPVDARGPDTLEAGGEVLTIPATGERWGEVEHVAAAVVTIGEALERAWTTMSARARAAGCATARIAARPPAAPSIADGRRYHRGRGHPRSPALAHDPADPRRRGGRRARHRHLAGLAAPLHRPHPRLGNPSCGAR